MTKLSTKPVGGFFQIRADFRFCQEGSPDLHLTPCLHLVFQHSPVWSFRCKRGRPLSGKSAVVASHQQKKREVSWRVKEDFLTHFFETYSFWSLLKVFLSQKLGCLVKETTVFVTVHSVSRTSQFSYRRLIRQKSSTLNFFKENVGTVRQTRRRARLCFSHWCWTTCCFTWRGQEVTVLGLHTLSLSLSHSLAHTNTFMKTLLTI